GWMTGCWTISASRAMTSAPSSRRWPGAGRRAPVAAMMRRIDCPPGRAILPGMAERSAGVLMYRRRGPGLHPFLVPPGGPFWAKKDDAAWSFPKGLLAEGEPALAAARREFEEETGPALEGELVELGTFRQPSGKLISAWAVEGDGDPAAIRSNSFAMEWP